MDGVDILTLSVGPDEPPEDTLTFLSMFDIFMLSARKAGVFVAQAAGNHGPGPYTVVSYSPWAVGVAACDTDRRYSSTLILGNGQQIGGVGLSGSLNLGGDIFSTTVQYLMHTIQLYNVAFALKREYPSQIYHFPLI